MMMMMMMSFLWPQSTPPHSARGQSQVVFRLDAVLEAKRRRKLGAVHRESGKWPQQPHFAKNKLLGAAGSEMFSAVSPPLSRFDELWQLHNNTWQQPGPLTQQEPLQSGFDPKDTGSQLVWGGRSPVVLPWRTLFIWSVDVTGICFLQNVKDKVLTHLTVSLIYCSQWNRAHIMSWN